MFENNVFDRWLDAKAESIIAAIGEGKAISSEEMMVLVLKAQTNHFNHLDVELRQEMKDLNVDLRQEMKDLREDMDKRFEQVDKRFEQVDKRFDTLVRRMDRFMIWSFSTTVAVGGFVVAAIKLLP